MVGVGVAGQQGLAVTESRQSGLGHFEALMSKTCLDLQGVFKDRQEQLILAFYMRIKRCLPNTGIGRDAGQRGPLIAMPSELHDGGIEYPSQRGRRGG